MLEEDRAAIQGLRTAIQRLTENAANERAWREAMLRDTRKVANASYVHQHDTSGDESDAVDLVRELGAPAMGLRVHSVGGGTLQVAINGGKWVPVVAGDFFDNEVIRQVKLRTTTPAAGTAVLRFTAYVAK